MLAPSSSTATAGSLPNVPNSIEDYDSVSEFAKLTLLLRLTLALSGDGDCTIDSYTEDRAAHSTPEDSADIDANLAVLDAVTAVLVQKHEIVAACY